MAPRQRLSTSPPPEEDDRSRSPLQIQRKHNGSPNNNNNNNKDDDKSNRQRTSNTIPKGHQVSDLDRDRHDIFNLIALLPINTLTISNWNWPGFLEGQGLETAWTGNYFMHLWSATMIYFVVDLLWVAHTPTCVKSPGMIVKHHMLVIVYLFAPLMWPMFHWFMGACLTVEINTWFLIARRLCYKTEASKPLQQCVSQLFYLSWIIVRCGIYPGILCIFLSMIKVAYHETGTLMHWQIAFLPCHVVLCVLNLKWTYDLFYPILFGGKGANSSKKTTAPANGL